MDIRRYDIVQADLGQVIGSEQGGIRPVLIIQNDVGNIHSCTTIVMPLSTKLKSLKQPTHTLIKRSTDTGLKTDSILLGEQMRVISSQRIIKKIGTVTDKNERNEICDDFVRQLNLFTEKQEIHNIEPHGMQKIILLRE